MGDRLPQYVVPGFILHSHAVMPLCRNAALPECRSAPRSKILLFQYIISIHSESVSSRKKGSTLFVGNALPALVMFVVGKG